MVSLPAAATAMSAASIPFTFGDEQARTAPRIVAQQTAEMFCYLWYSSSLATAATRAKRSHMHPPRSPQDSTRLALQLSPAPAFVDFVLRLLETTQVSQSVIVLGLHYVYRLKESAVLSFGQAGSENRVAVVALMLANKFVDDNTYTNKTWADVSNIDLREINRMEREFLQSIEYRLAVDAATYHSWLNLLRGLVQAKDRELRLWTVQQLKLLRKTPDHRRSDTPRARSSSPTLRDPAAYPFTFVVPTSTAAQYPHHSHSYCVPPSTAPGPSSSSPPRKRVRETFSPVSAHPAKRAFVEYREPATHDVDMHHQQSQQPVLHVQTQLAQYPQHQQQQLSAGAVERSFARMSLAPQQHQPQNQQQLPSPQEPGYSSQPRHQPLQQQGQALVAACHPDVNVNVGPQTLYYIKLASSPSEGEADRERKGRLQYHQPTQQLPAHSQQAAPTVYSAAASYSQAYSTPGPALNPYPTPVTAAAYAPANRLAMSTNTSPIPVAVSYGQQQQYAHSQQQQQRTVVHPHLANILTPPPSSSGTGQTINSFVQVPAYQQSQPAHVHPNAQPAPFANAGPAGVRMHWATNAPPVAAAGSGTQSVYAQHARHVQGRAMAGPVGAGGRRILRSQASLPETQGWSQQSQPQSQPQPQQQQHHLQQQPSPQPQLTYDQQVPYGGQMQALQAPVQHWQQQQPYPSPPAQQSHTSPHVHQQQYYVSPPVQPYPAWPSQGTETSWSAAHQNQQVHGWAAQAHAEWPRVVV